MGRKSLQEPAISERAEQGDAALQGWLLTWAPFASSASFSGGDLTTLYLAGETCVRKL